MADDLKPAGMLGYGSKARIGRGATPQWTAIALVGDIDAPDEQVDDVDVTHQQSKGRRKEYIPGLIDSGELSIPVNYIPGSVTDVLCREIKAAGEIVLIELTLSESGTPETFVGYLKGYARSAPVDDKMTATLTFRLSGVVESVGG